jgi:hypothetical protein
MVHYMTHDSPEQKICSLQYYDAGGQILIWGKWWKN